MRFFGPCLLVLVALCLVAGPAAAQQKTTLDHIVDAVQRGDFRTIKKLVETLPNEVIGSFFSSAEAYLEAKKSGDSTRSQTFADVMSQLGNALYVTKNNKNYERYAGFIQSLRITNLQSWLDGWKAYREFKGTYAKAWEEKNTIAFQYAIEQAQGVIPHFERIRDFFLLGWVYQDIGRLHGQLGNTDQATEAYEEAIRSFEYCGAEDKMQETRTFIDQLKSGVKTAIQEEEQRKAEEERKAKEAAEKPLWTKVSLTYRAKKKFDYTTDSPLDTEEYINWNGTRIVPEEFGAFFDAQQNDGSTFMWYAVNEGINLNPRSQSPLLRYQFMHEKKKIYLDTNDDGLAQKGERISLSGRPKFIELDLETEPVSSGAPTIPGQQVESSGDEGVRQFKYAFKMCLLAQDKFFGFDMNYEPGNLRWQRACYMQGADLDGQKVVLIDDNSNGTYSDYGMDAIAIGGGKQAVFLSEVVPVGDKLYKIKVEDPLGEELSWMPYTGPTGKVSVKFKAKKPSTCLYINGTGANSRTVIKLDPKGETTVPVGKYTFYYGLIRDGKGRNAASVEMRRGDSKSFEVTEGEVATLQLGAPFTFAYKVKTEGARAVLRGRDLTVKGASGEVYTRFFPHVPKGDVMISAGGKGILTKSKLKPIDRGLLAQVGINMAWFPRDVFWDRVSKEGDEYTLRIKAKHSLLGTIYCDFSP